MDEKLVIVVESRYTTPFQEKHVQVVYKEFDMRDAVLAERYYQERRNDYKGNDQYASCVIEIKTKLL